MKECFKCGVTKPLLDFYRHKAMADGHLNKCKECTKSDVRERRATNPAVQEYDRERGCRQDASYLREYRAKYPNKYKAHRAVSKAVKEGTLCNPGKCECGSTYHVEAHHDDYAKPLDVRWLCALCHKRWHSEHGESPNGG